MHANVAGEWNSCRISAGGAGPTGCSTETHTGVAAAHFNLLIILNWRSLQHLRLLAHLCATLVCFYNLIPPFATPSSPRPWLYPTYLLQSFSLVCRCRGAGYNSPFFFSLLLLLSFVFQPRCGRTRDPIFQRDQIIWKETKKKDEERVEASEAGSN